MRKPYKAVKQTYLTYDGKHTRVTFHPAVLFEGDESYCYFSDETLSGFVEHDNRADALANAKRLYNHYVLGNQTV